MYRHDWQVCRVTETRAPYLEELPAVVYCPSCHRIIGWRLECDGVEVFYPVGLIVSRDFHRWYCQACGNRYHTSGKLPEN